MSINWQEYTSELFFDELIDKQGEPRAPSKRITHYLGSLSDEDLDLRRQMADATIQQMGITFTLYNNEKNIDRNWPFDIIPRTISAAQWHKTAAGLEQRLQALNLFIDDIYHQQRILKDGVLPSHLVVQQKSSFTQYPNFSLAA